MAIVSPNQSTKMLRTVSFSEQYIRGGGGDAVDCLSEHSAWTNSVISLRKLSGLEARRAHLDSEFIGASQPKRLISQNLCGPVMRI